MSIDQLNWATISLVVKVAMLRRRITFVCSGPRTRQSSTQNPLLPSRILGKETVSTALTSGAVFCSPPGFCVATFSPDG